MAVRPRPRPPIDPLTAGDRRLLAVIEAQSEILRAVLCHFARLGVAWRKREPQRTSAWLAKLESSPFYKGGQFLFDLLEWEDFMLDGPRPPPVSSGELMTIALRVAAEVGIEVPAVELPAIETSLPPIEPGFYLYRDVLLGLLFVLQTAASTTTDR